VAASKSAQSSSAVHTACASAARVRAAAHAPRARAPPGVAGRESETAAAPQHGRKSARTPRRAAQPSAMPRIGWIRMGTLSTKQTASAHRPTSSAPASRRPPPSLSAAAAAAALAAARAAAAGHGGRSAAPKEASRSPATPSPKSA
jgi:hypothetical protein